MTANFQTIYVSILILLEVILEAWSSPLALEQLQVSILILLEVILEEIDTSMGKYYLEKFQSLFYWK